MENTEQSGCGKIRPVRLYRDAMGFYIIHKGKKRRIRIPAQYSKNIKDAQRFTIRHKLAARILPKARKPRKVRKALRRSYRMPALSTRVKRVEATVPLSVSERQLLDQLKKEKRDREEHDSEEKHKAALAVLAQKEAEIKAMSMKLLEGPKPMLPDGRPLDQAVIEQEAPQSDVKHVEAPQSDVKHVEAPIDEPDEKQVQAARQADVEEKTRLIGELAGQEEEYNKLFRAIQAIRVNAKTRGPYSKVNKSERQQIGELQKQADEEGKKWNAMRETYKAKYGEDYKQQGTSIRDQSGSGRSTALWSNEIDDFFSEEPNYLGTIASDQIDELPEEIELPAGFVMNTDKSDQPGTHWVSVFITPDSLEYYDSSGHGPDKHVIEQFKRLVERLQLPTLVKMKINKIAAQRASSNNCGYFAIRFLDSRFNGVPFDEATEFRKRDKDGIINQKAEGEATIKKEFKLI